MKPVKPILGLLLVGTSLVLLASNSYAQSGKTCPLSGSEVPFAKVMNDAFAPDYAGCDITVKVEFVAAGGTPNYDWESIKGTAGKVAFRVVVPGEQVGSGLLDIPPHIFLPKDKADVIFSFKRGDILIVRGAPSMGPIKGVPPVFIATDLIAASASDAEIKRMTQPKSDAPNAPPSAGTPEVTTGKQDVENVQEPEYSGTVFFLNPAGALLPLEKQMPNSQVKVIAGGFGGAKVSVTFNGPASPTRFKAGQDVQFVVRLIASGIDPESLMSLEVLKVSKDHREVVAVKAGSLGSSSKSTSGEFTRPLNFSKYGQQSVKLSPTEPLAPGEYAITNKLEQSAFLFGIDPN